MVLRTIFVQRRCDRADLASIKRTDEGFLIVEGFVAKPGILIYRGPDGQEVRELVTAESLHRDDSLETLKRKPVTLKHPGKDVDPRSVKQVRVGSVGTDVEITEDGRVKVSFTVERSDAIKAVEDGTHQLSPGYRVEIDPTPGIHPIFGRYDAIQVSRRYNHLAIVDRARGGPQIHLRADEAWDRPAGLTLGEPMLKFLALLVAAGMKREDAQPVADQCEIETQVRVDGATLQTRADLVLAESARDVLQHEADNRKDVEPEAQPLGKRLDWFDERTTILGLAGDHGIEGDALKVDNEALALAVVRKIDSDCADDASPEYVAAFLKIHAKSRKDSKRPAGSLYRDNRADAFDPDQFKKKKKSAEDAHFDAIEEERLKKLEVK